MDEATSIDREADKNEKCLLPAWRGCLHWKSSWILSWNETMGHYGLIIVPGENGCF
jgi:hypothetical protein